jgi:Uma2 family endonuclease
LRCARDIKAFCIVQESAVSRQVSQLIRVYQKEVNGIAKEVSDRPMPCQQQEHRIGDDVIVREARTTIQHVDGNEKEESLTGSLIARGAERGRDDVGDLEHLLEQPVIEVAPDITIEIISKNETRCARTARIEDYRRIGVKECWIVSPQAQTIEVLRLSPEGIRTAGLYGVGMRVQSEILAG